MEGLTSTDRAILDIVLEHHRQLQTTGHADRVTVERMAARIGVEPVSILSSIKHLIGLCLLGMKPGSGQWPNEYLLALPRRLAAATSSVAAHLVPDELVPPF
jgi:hypothetical protein